MVPVILVGAGLGTLVVRRIRQDWFNAAVFWLAVVSAAKLLLFP